MFLNCIKALTMVLLLVIVSSGAEAGETLISYQGRVTWPGGTPVTDGDHTVSFSLYTDSTGGSPLWTETAIVTTTSGLFVHLLGSIAPLQASVVIDNDPLYLQLSIESQVILPRTRLTSVPRSIVAEGLQVSDDTGLVVLQTAVNAGGVLHLFDVDGNLSITLHGGREGDSAVMLPASSIGSEEILDEPGIAGYANSGLIELSTGDMADMVGIEITTPADGYIVVYGKCYLLLSGTTGANSARVQIDETEGGVSQYPFYTQAGLSGYVNTGTNYFPIYVTRTFYKSAGTYEFRMEGRAMNSPPALAQSWDHQLTAVFFPSSYGWVSGFTADPSGFPSAQSVSSRRSDSLDQSEKYYDVDLRDLEIEDKR